ncbi:MAG: TylF/MycF/NovP-related O-methyltransferase [Chloroflexota bacterium]
MNNLFIRDDKFDWRNDSRKVSLANQLLNKAGIPARLRPLYATGFMTNLEQRMNLYHLVSQVLAYGVTGDLAEAGTYVGSTAVLMQLIIDGEGQGQTLHVYDSFEKSWGADDPLKELKANFDRYCGKRPAIHEGRFDQTMPSELPDAIAFINIDCGWGGPTHRNIARGYDDSLHHHDAILRHILEHIYPRLSPGAVCSLIDYWHPSLHDGLHNPNPAVQPTVDELLANKPETISVLYAGDNLQAYFRKSGGR